MAKENKEAQRTIERILTIINILSNSPQGMTLKELESKLGVSNRTLRRYLKTLSDGGISLDETSGPHGQKFWQIRRKILSEFTYDEAAALCIGRAFLEPLAGTFLAEAADRALKKIRDQLGSVMNQNVEKFLKIFDIKEESPKPSKEKRLNYAAKQEIIETLVSACENHHEVMISYRSLKSRTDETYRIRPYEISFRENSLYVIAYSLKSQAIRCLKVDRISKAEETRTSFSPLRHNLDYVMFETPDKKPKKVIVRYDPMVARYVQERKWHSSEKLTEFDDGSLLAEYELRELASIRIHILTYGPHAEVLEPPALRQKLHEDAIKMLALYQKENKKPKK